MKKFKKLILILLSVLFVLGVFSGCGEEKSFAWGFRSKQRIQFGGCGWVAGPQCAVSGDSRAFDKNDVTFDLHYGTERVYEEEQLKGFHIAVTYATKIDEKYSGKNEYELKILKTVEDNIFSEKYKVTTEKKGLKKLYHFSHSEPITIPPEAFNCGNSFDISILYYDSEGEGQEISAYDLPQGVQSINFCTISYKVEGDNIVFTGYGPEYYNQ